jgi:hypothetical protein
MSTYAANRTSGVFTQNAVSPQPQNLCSAVLGSTVFTGSRGHGGLGRGTGAFITAGFRPVIAVTDEVRAGTFDFARYSMRMVLTAYIVLFGDLLPSRPEAWRFRRTARKLNRPAALDRLELSTTDCSLRLRMR